MKNIILLLIISLLFLCSCANSKNNEEEKNKFIETTNTENNEIIESDTSENFPSYEEIKEKYPDKTVIVWIIEGTGWDYECPFRTMEINEYLNNNGYDLAVCFEPIMYSTEAYYTDIVENMINNSEQVDIIYSSFTNVGEAGNNAYHKDVYNGFFEPLDEYFETDIGKKLYNIML